VSEGAPDHRTPLGWFGLFTGPMLCVALLWGQRSGWLLDPARPALNAVAAVTALMALWWVTEAIPVAVTGLLPLVLFPLLDLAPARDVAAAYGNRLLFLFLGGFLIALAVEESGLHRRLALAVIAWVGGGASRLILGMILATGLLSMWMSNTATTILMLPIATSLMTHVDACVADEALRRRFGTALMLGVAYAASLGGMATLIGTPTNVLFKELYIATLGERAPPITFGGWMLMAAPLSLTLLVLCWALLAKLLFPVGNESVGGHEMIAIERARLGPLRPVEWRAGAIFVITALLWVFREPLAGWGWAPLIGWGKSSSGAEPVDDATIAVFMALVCFIIPRDRLVGRPLLEWRRATDVPWGVLLLFGGGLALAQGMAHTGLDKYLGGAIGDRLVGMSPVVIAIVLALGVTLLSELTSNIACVNITLPVMASLAQSIECDPRLLMLPAALAASCGFMLPVATAPNAIAYGTGRISARQMLWAGLWLDLVCVLAIVLFVFVIGVPALGVSLHGLPDWARPAP